MAITNPKPVLNIEKKPSFFCIGIVCRAAALMPYARLQRYYAYYRSAENRCGYSGSYYKFFWKNTGRFPYLAA